jgi:pimeloyl-ACP methyl ester carboxylesterase
MSTELTTSEDRVAELRALTRLAADELGGAVGGGGSMHRAIAERVLAAVEKGVGPGAAPVKATHHAIAGGVYAALRGATAALGAGADAALRLRDAGDGPAPSTTRGGSLAIGILQGLRGDALERERSPLAQPMAVRVDGRPVTPRRDALAAAFPDATPRLVIFTHGLMETEFSWWLGAAEHGDTYGSRLRRDLGCTPVYVRYNSGRHISENGRSLSELLETVVEQWPVEVEEIALVGHSMGGLVARSACYVAARDGGEWVRSVRHVVSLGSPHFGAPLEEIVHATSAALGALPETRPFANFLRRRSAGIRDLRRGSLVDEDWRDRDPDALRAVACQEVPLLEGATHCFVAATVTRSPRHPVGRLIGDLLVLEPSASGRSRSRRLGFKAEHGAHLGGATHFALLNHPVIYEKLRGWLSTPPEQLAREGGRVALSRAAGGGAPPA